MLVNFYNLHVSRKANRVGKYQNNFLMKNLKKLSRNNLKVIKGGVLLNDASTCSTTCSNGREATVTCSGSCSTSDEKWAGCNDGSNETSINFIIK